MFRVQRSCQTHLEYPTTSKFWDKWLLKRAILSIDSPRQFGGPRVEVHTSKYLYVHIRSKYTDLRSVIIYNFILTLNVLEYL